MNTSSKQDSSGFTVVELVVVIVILGILSAFAAPRFFGASVFNERGYADEIAASLRHAQKIAVATGCDVRVSIDAAGYSAQQRDAGPGNTCQVGGAWSTPVMRPDGTALAGSTPSDVATASAQFVFDARGRLATSASTTVGPYTVGVTDGAFVEVQ